MPKYLPWICIAMLLIGMAPLPFGYYTLLRIVSFSTFAIGTFISFKKGHESLWIYYGLMAMLFNPFLPIEHAKWMWIFFDILAVGLLFFTSKEVTINKRPS